MQEGFAGARDDMLVGLADVKSELGRQIQTVAEETRHSRVLIEEALSQIVVLANQRKELPGRKPKAPRRKR
jgi:hypothetical protein